MIALLLAASDHIEDIVKTHINPLGFSYVRYRQALKAMDNIDEVNPDAVIISAEDFPRHWKILAQFIRNERSKNKTTIVILKGKNFAYDEAAKAAHIGINGIIDDSLDSESERERLKSILGRHIAIDEKRASSRFTPSEKDKLHFMFTHPHTQKLILGSILSFSSTGFTFSPQNIADTSDLKSGEEINRSTLRVGENFLNPVCKIIRNEHMIIFEFSTFSATEEGMLNTYLENRTKPN